MDEGLSRAVQTIFKRLYDDGLIYRAERIINWCPRCRTALSDIEVEHTEDDGELVSIRYGDGDDVDRRRDHPGRDDARRHRRRRAPRRRALPAPGRHARSSCRWSAGGSRSSPTTTSTRRSAPARSRSRRRTTRTTSRSAGGTSCRSLTIMDERGIITAHRAVPGARPVRGQAARCVAALRAQGRIVAEKRPYVHSVGHCSRCDHGRRAAAVAAVVRPGRAAGQGGRRRGPRRPGRRSTRGALEPRYFDWVDNMHDWCISRQLWWGHRIPVWYGPDGEMRLRRPGRAAADRRGLDPGRRRARHLVLVRAVAVLHAGLAGRHPGPAPLLPDRRAGHRLRHPVLLGRPDDDVRALRDGRRPAVRRGRAARHGPRQVRQEDVEVVRQHGRPARLDGRVRRRTRCASPWPAAPTPASTCRSARSGCRAAATSATSSGTRPGSRC